MKDLQAIKDKLDSAVDEVENYPERVHLIDDIISEIREQKEALRRKKNSLLYPKQASDDKEIRRIGLTEESNAILFLNSPQSSTTIKNNLINALEMDKIDFASTIFQKLKPQIPVDEDKWIEIKAKSQEKFKLLLAVDLLYREFCNQRGITEIINEVVSLNKLESRAIEFKQNLNKYITTN
jgi:hypothetical protein